MIASFELAMLAKEKGFDLPCIYAYCESGGKNKYTGKIDPIKHVLRTDGNPFGSYYIGKNWNQKYKTNKNKIRCSAPTLDEVQKWLREKHKIQINIIAQDFRESYIWWVYEIVFPIGESRTHAIYNGEFKTFEQALESGIIHALNNL